MVTPHPTSLRRQLRTPPTENCRLAKVCLEQSGYSALRGIGCDFQDGILRLTGCVPSYHLKPVALTRVAGIEGVREIQDEIKVLGTDLLHAARQKSRLLY
ncbi:hypothetical protein BH23PLA1_BH23PLA1_40360 [soil metagenome]